MEPNTVTKRTAKITAKITANPILAVLSPSYRQNKLAVVGGNHTRIGSGKGTDYRQHTFWL
jgi:hypothetical protein